jgi:RNA-binding protein YlmH
VLAVGFSTSRGKAAEAVETGRGQVNWTVCQKPDKQVAEGDVISVRGAGKCRLTTVGNMTKKGRIFITVERYL